MDQETKEPRQTPTLDLVKNILSLLIMVFVIYEVYYEAGIFTCISVIILTFGFGAVNKRLIKEEAIREMQVNLISARLLKKP